VVLNQWLIKADHIWPETRQHPVVQTPPGDLFMNIQHLLTGTLKSISELQSISPVTNLCTVSGGARIFRLPGHSWAPEF
jgi:hypothetical protein